MRHLFFTNHFELFEYIHPFYHMHLKKKKKNLCVLLVLEWLIEMYLSYLNIELLFPRNSILHKWIKARNRCKMIATYLLKLELENSLFMQPTEFGSPALVYSNVKWAVWRYCGYHLFVCEVYGRVIVCIYGFLEHLSHKKKY